MEYAMPWNEKEFYAYAKSVSVARHVCYAVYAARHICIQAAHLTDYLITYYYTYIIIYILKIELNWAGVNRENQQRPKRESKEQSVITKCIWH